MKNTMKLNENNVQLEVITWESESPIYNLIIIHGASEYIERYDHFAKYLNRNNINVYGINHLGHGPKRNMDYEGVVFSDNKKEPLIIENQLVLVNHLKKTSNLPLIILGHSMGSVILRNIIKQSNIDFEKVIISGSVFPRKIEVNAGLFAVECNLKTRGRNKVSKKLNKLVFKDLISSLSFSETNIANYSNDLHCGMPFTNGALYELLYLTKQCIIELDKLPKTKYLIVSGAKDPFSNNTSDLKRYVAKLKSLDYNVKYKFYENMKHEILNEDNKQIVYEDILSFIINGDLNVT